MDLLTPLVNAYPMFILSVLVVFYMRGRFAKIEAETKDVRQEVRDLRTEMNGRFEQVAGEIAGLRAEMNGRFEQQAREIAGLRSDLTLVALAVGARTRPEAGSA